MNCISVLFIISLLWQHSYHVTSFSKSRKQRIKLKRKLTHSDKEYAQLEGTIPYHVPQSSNTSQGAWTEYAIKRMLWKALHGKDVMMYVIGESVSVGADLGKNNTLLTYHFLIAKWWNNTIGRITGSRMHRKVIAVGGVSSAYFDRCWTEYVDESEQFDFLIWEFNINDASVEADELVVSIERFTRSLYSRYKSLNLLYSIFYTSTLFDRRSFTGTHNQFEINKPPTRRHSISENITFHNAYYYNVSCLNIEDLIARNTSKEEMFTKSHPSKTAHAQMAFLTVRLFKQVMVKKLSSTSSRCHDDAPKIQLPASLYVKDESHDVVCWTSVYVDYRHKSALKHLLFDLPKNKTKHVHKVVSDWESSPEQRYDLTGGYDTWQANQSISFQFNVTSSASDRIYSPHREVSVAMRFHKGIRTRKIIQAILRVNQTLVAQKNITQELHPSDGLFVSVLSSLVPTGHAQLDLNVLLGNMRICAIIIC